MPFQLSVFNPSDYWRKGHIAVPWQPIHERTGILPEDVALYDASGSRLPAQVDRVDPADPSRDALVFSLVQPIPPGPDENYSIPSSSVSVVQDGETEGMENGPGLLMIGEVDEQVRGVKLYNKRLVVWFNLIAAPWEDHRTWFAGSSSTVELDGKEILVPFQAEMSWEGHDPEKRCMQIDQLQVLRPPWEDNLVSTEVIQLESRPYQLVSQSAGPVRASITVASEPFGYNYSDPFTDQTHHLTCKLYRVISLYAGADYVMEELFIKAQPREMSKSDQVSVNLFFEAHYFAYLGMGHDAQIYQYPHVPDWFALGSPWSPYPGYGFATDVHTYPVSHPHPNHFSWKLQPGRRATCLHLFMRGQQGGLDSRAGHHWYEFVYKPLKATI